MSKIRKQIRVYVADVEPLADPGKYWAAYGKVSEARRKKTDRFRFASDKRLSLGAGLLLQKVLERAGILDREIGVMPNGKPYLKNTKDWFFNLSHSGTKVLCALAREPVGCDIERMENPPLELAPKVFSSQEQNQLFSLNGEAQRQYFYKLWTGKESYLKMTGEGLRHMPADFTISVPFASQVIENRLVAFYEVSCGEGYQGTVCKEAIIWKDMHETAFQEKIYLKNPQGTVPTGKLLAEYIEL